MLDSDTRTTILRLHAQGHGINAIKRALHVSRNSVRSVLASGVAEVPALVRAQKLDEHIDQIRDLFVLCKGNLVRVHEKLGEVDVEIGYTTLTAFCRAHHIGTEPVLPAGRYHFEPGEEMQHDTSPHDVVIAGRTRRLQCASLVLCYSRTLFFQVYPRFNRFWAKVFLVEAILYFLGCARRCMVDNTSVLIAHGTGADAVPPADLEALGNHFGFKIVAHEKGDANRSARVERPFWYIERNFYPGRTFNDLNDVNAQARVWCDQSNNKYRRSLKGSAFERLTAERPALVALPIHVPEVTHTEQRSVDAEGYVHFQTNRYPVPSQFDLIHHNVQVLASKSRVRIFDGHKLVAEHPRLEDGMDGRIATQEPGRHRRAERKRELPEAPVLRSAAPVLGDLVAALERRHGGRAVRHVMALYRMYLDYPTDILREVVTTALAHGLIDLHRIETMVLSRLAGGDFFRLPEVDAVANLPPFATTPHTDPVSTCVDPNASQPPAVDTAEGDNDHDHPR
jgi:transposase